MKNVNWDPNVSICVQGDFCNEDNAIKNKGYHNPGHYDSSCAFKEYIK